MVEHRKLTKIGIWYSSCAVVEDASQDLFSWRLLERDIWMAESVYKVIELVGTSDESWEKAASAAVAQAAGSLRDLRIAEVVELDLQIEDGQVKTYRAKVKVSFKLRSR
jgi:dodecin